VLTFLKAAEIPETITTGEIGSHLLRGASKHMSVIFQVDGTHLNGRPCTLQLICEYPNFWHPVEGLT
jgi:hypothetical protein